MLSFHTFGESVCLVVELLLVALELLSPKGVGDVAELVVDSDSVAIGSVLLWVEWELLSPKGVGDVAELVVDSGIVGIGPVPVAAVVEADEADPNYGVLVEMLFTTAVALSMMLTCCASPALPSS